MRRCLHYTAAVMWKSDSPFPCEPYTCIVIIISWISVGKVGAILFSSRSRWQSAMTVLVWAFIPDWLKHNCLRSLIDSLSRFTWTWSSLSLVPTTQGETNQDCSHYFFAPRTNKTYRPSWTVTSVTVLRYWAIR